MRVVCDVEANGLLDTVTKIHVIACKDIDTGEENVFLHGDPAFRDFAARVGTWIGHNFLHYDLHVLNRLALQGMEAIRPERVVDTLVISRLLDYGLEGGHSLEAWGERLGTAKVGTTITDWSVYTPLMEERCRSDAEINYKLYRHFLPWINSDRWRPAIELEHYVASTCFEMKQNGFYFDVDKAHEVRYNILEELGQLDAEIQRSFPPKAVLLREITPRATQHGTLHRGDFRWVSDGDLTPYSVGASFSLIKFEPFNPASPSQIVQRLNEAGWKPVEKTKGHIQAERDRDQERLKKFRVTGWKVSEANLTTLPDTAPKAAHTLARRIMLSSRESDLKEWIESVGKDHRIHGTVNGIGAWTHRCSHNNPNTGNIPRPDALFGREMREMWSVPFGSYLVGVDAEGIQLRVLAHYINDDRFTQSLISGSKEDGTDPHSLNKQALGESCATRNDAKTFIYAWLLGAGLGKVADILNCNATEAKIATENFVRYYPGLAYVKQELIPADANRGYFEGFDGRYIKIFGDDYKTRCHFALAGYLQGGEVIIMKQALKIWKPKLEKERIPFKLVNFVHDEFQTEVMADYDTAMYVANIQADAIRQAGEDFKLLCPMAGSILGGHGKIAIGSNWYETH